MSAFSKIAAGVNPENEADTKQKSPEKKDSPAPQRSLSVGERLGKGMLLSHNEALENEIKRLTDEAKASKRVLDLPLKDLFEIPGRKRSLDPENFEILKNNLATNDLITPIIVRVRTEGGYEIVSGHNRTQAYRELGRPTISAIVAQIDEKDVSKDAFFANLIHSSLPDYEKYLGFKKLQEEHPGATQDTLSQISGVSRQLITFLLSYDKLPASCHPILANAPGILGSNAAFELSKTISEANAKLVPVALQKLANKELDQKDVAAFITAKPAPNPTGKKPPPAYERNIKQGKAVFCKLRQVKQTIRLDVKAGEDAQALADAIADFLANRIKSA